MSAIITEAEFRIFVVQWCPTCLHVLPFFNGDHHGHDDTACFARGAAARVFQGFPSAFKSFNQGFDFKGFKPRRQEAPLPSNEGALQRVKASRASKLKPFDLRPSSLQALRPSTLLGALPRRSPSTSKGFKPFESLEGVLQALRPWKPSTKPDLQPFSPLPLADPSSLHPSKPWSPS